MMELVVGLVGAVALDAEALVDVLAGRSSKHFCVREFRIFAGKAHVSKRVYFGQERIAVEEVNLKRMCDCDVLFVSSELGLSVEKIESLHAAGVVTIFLAPRVEPELSAPKAIAEIESQALASKKWLKEPSIAMPSGAMALAALALAPLVAKFGLKRVAVTALVSASDFGRAGLDLLQEESQAFFQVQDLSSRSSALLPRSLAFNAMPFEEDESAVERMGAELVEVLGVPSLKVDVTPVRLPVFVGHAASLVFETQNEVSVEEIRTELAEQDWISVDDGTRRGELKGVCSPREMHGKDVVRVSHVRDSACFKNGKAIWIVGDNLRRGVALSAVGLLGNLVQGGMLQALRNQKSKEG
jgi:aspartate-semialdehyde dehydrogenase